MVDQFIYLASNIAATESNVNISALAKATVERLSLIWKSNLPVGMKKKKGCFQSIATSVLLYGGMACTLTKASENQ